MLENEGLAVGVVTAVAGQLRCRLTWTGKASHAGTTPAPLRRDALAGAAEFIREVEKGSEKFGGLMATVGRLAIEPNVSNVVPGPGHAHVGRAAPVGLGAERGLRMVGAPCG